MKTCKQWFLLGLMAWIVAACAALPASQELPAGQPQASEPPIQPSEDLPATALIPPPAVSPSPADAEQRAREDLAVFLSIDVSQVETLGVETRTWPQGVRGCQVQRGLEEATPVPGWRVILRAKGTAYEYRLGEDGGMVRCPMLDKPLGPIQ